MEEMVALVVALVAVVILEDLEVLTDQMVEAIVAGTMVGKAKGQQQENSEIPQQPNIQMADMV